MSTSDINVKLRAAQNNLREIKRRAAELRENHLMELLSITKENGMDKQHERRLQILIRAHRKQHAYKKIQYILKPNEKGGIASILVPKGSSPEAYPYVPDTVTEWTRIHEHDKLQEFIQQRNQTHFRQRTERRLLYLHFLIWIGARKDQKPNNCYQGKYQKNLRATIDMSWRY
jgi:hypothetical protein